ncbi:MAG: BrnT family toxin [Patescibacteria group bacterium]
MSDDSEYFWKSFGNIINSLELAFEYTFDNCSYKCNNSLVPDILFEWDINKNESNYQKHGINFEQAKEIFSQKYIVLPAKSETEERSIAVGKLNEIIVIAVIFTIRNTTIRLISARIAKTKEARLYNKLLN